MSLLCSALPVLFRADHRHNYSIWWYAIYLTGDERSEQSGLPLRTLLSLGAMVPQAIFICFSARHIISGSEAGTNQTALCRKLTVCLFVTTAVFVHANKVLTAQYFVWYLAIFPAVWPRLFFTLKHLVAWCLVAFVMWLGSMLLWLYFAYQLEFNGKNVWSSLWVASLIFFLTSFQLIAIVLCAHGDVGKLKD